MGLLKRVNGENGRYDKNCEWRWWCGIEYEKRKCKEEVEWRVKGAETVVKRIFSEEEPTSHFI